MFRVVQCLGRGPSTISDHLGPFHLKSGASAAFGLAAPRCFGMCASATLGPLGAPSLGARASNAFEPPRPAACRHGPLPVSDNQGPHRLAVVAFTALGTPGPPPLCGGALRRFRTTRDPGRGPPALFDHRGPSAFGHGPPPLSHYPGPRRFRTGACAALDRGPPMH